jgi:hypothetical protein
VVLTVQFEQAGDFPARRHLLLQPLLKRLKGSARGGRPDDDGGFVFDREI